MRKILSLIVTLCIGGAFANADAHRYATNEAALSHGVMELKSAESPYGITLAAEDEQVSLDTLKMRTVEKLNAKKDSTTQDVVKSFIDTSIADVNNATSAAMLDSITPMILAKVYGCIEVENKAKATPALNEAELNLISKSYTDIINAANLESVNSLISGAIGVIDLRQDKNKKIATVMKAYKRYSQQLSAPSDEETINKHIDNINKATQKYDVAKAYKDAIEYTKVMGVRVRAIKKLSKYAKKIEKYFGDEKAFDKVVEDIMNMDDTGKIEAYVERLIFGGGSAEKPQEDPTKGNALRDIYNAMQGYTDVDYINNLVAQELDAIRNSDNNDVIREKRDAAVNKLNVAVPAYRAALTDALGTLGIQQNGPVVEVTDQKDQLFKFYNPKKLTTTEEK